MSRALTDGGLETDLIFNRGVDLPEFAAFPLLDSDAGRTILSDYYAGYLALAVRLGVPLQLDTPTWMANPDRAAGVGYDAAALRRINAESVEFLAALAEEHDDELVEWAVGGQIGPRGDGYRSDGPVDAGEAAEYHRPQLEAFRAAGAHLATALTLSEVGEAVGVAQAGNDVGIRVAIGFTVETDGRLADGTRIGEAIAAVDRAAPPAYFLLNCAHPTHIAAGLEAGTWPERIGGLRVNASTMSHAELDEAETLDAGDPEQLAHDQAPLLDEFGPLEVLGGCCGTDLRHVTAMWQSS